MTVTEKLRRVRQSYEDRPYPSRANQRRWPIAPMEWIQAMGQTDAAPDRILVAGCGTGPEAFALRRKFPEAEIIGVDFSSRSIALAQATQRKARGSKKIRFVRADLTMGRLGRKIGSGFDLISCHGVLTYFADASKALRNFADCLSEGGCLYLGVNGAQHYSTGWRIALPAFGLDAERFHDRPDLRRTLRLFDALSGNTANQIARRSADYLASDLFTPIMFNRPLSAWIALCLEEGLIFRASYQAHRHLRAALNDDLYEILLPRSREEVHRLVDQIAPSSFHSLVFARHAAVNPPWQNRRALKKWRVLRTKIYSARLPKKRDRRADRLDKLSLRSPSTNTVADLLVPHWVSQVLQGTSRARELENVLEGFEISAASLRRHLYLLYLLGAINLLPPRRPGDSREQFLTVA